jgi:hypothetical protein
MTDRDKDYLESFLAHQRAALCRVLNDEVHKIHLRLVLEGADIEALIEEQRQICVREIDAHLQRAQNAVHGTRDRHDR